LYNWGLTEIQSSAVKIPTLYPPDGILPSIRSYHQFLIINLASVTGGQLVNSPTAASRQRYKPFMRHYIIYITILTLHLNSASGQTRIVLGGPSRIDTSTSPLVLVDTFKTDITHLVINPLQIDSISIFKDSIAILKFGDAGKYGVIIIHPKAFAKFLRVDKILDNYKLSNADRKLRICINKTLMRNPQLILIETSEIEDVEVTTDRLWINVEDANTGEKFINIITRTKDKNGL